jgi:hypothetical protein
MEDYTSFCNQALFYVGAENQKIALPSSVLF